ncbi:hypothetical protein BC832DRAFT_178784 [Gaertneriomyces semiglobifer]|nr:hypothetical protein BC832DRAFT_178784 [Gaertneriomyces semiglobifer]
MTSRLIRLTLDLVGISTVISGTTRASGVEVNTRKIEDPTFRGIVDKYLSVGEWVMDTGEKQIRKYPDWFASRR